MNKISDRHSEMFWVLDDYGNVKHERGYECPPNDGYWWFPSLHFSTNRVFETKDEAERQSIEDCEKKQETKEGAIMTPDLETREYKFVWPNDSMRHAVITFSRKDAGNWELDGCKYYGVSVKYSVDDWQFMHDLSRVVLDLGKEMEC